MVWSHATFTTDFAVLVGEKLIYEVTDKDQPVPITKLIMEGLAGKPVPEGVFPEGDLMVTVKKVNNNTKEEYSVTVDADKYMHWKNGDGSVQTLFPELTPEQREFLINGLTPDEWKEAVMRPEV